MTELPSGTATFLFTDIEGSTQLWEQHPEEMRLALAQHDGVLSDAIASNHGHIIKTTGDGVHAVFEKAIDAVHATLETQRRLQSSRSQNPAASIHIKVRMGLHTGEAELHAGDYYGQSLNRAARIMSTGHGGQILLSAITAELAREHLAADLTLLDLGEHQLRDLIRPEHIFQLNTPELINDFPALKSLTTLPNNLPHQLTSFIGHEREIQEANRLLESTRLLTLVGPAERARLGYLSISGQNNSTGSLMASGWLNLRRCLILRLSCRPSHPSSTCVRFPEFHSSIFCWIICAPRNCCLSSITANILWKPARRWQIRCCIYRRI